jgi:hypothetical protein
MKFITAGDQVGVQLWCVQRFIHPISQGEEQPGLRIFADEEAADEYIKNSRYSDDNPGTELRRVHYSKFTHVAWGSPNAGVSVEPVR